MFHNYVLLQELLLLEKEINMLKVLKHERIVVYHGAERSETSVTIFMEYMTGVRNLSSNFKIVFTSW